jgi:FkbM family methyltransferase
VKGQLVKKITMGLVLFFTVAALVYLSQPADAGKILETEKNLYAQGHEELIARDFFNDRRGGTFVDIGCSDYKEFSTTYYLEQHLGWKGIGVDALDEYADDYKKYRPQTTFLNYVVTDHTGGTTPIFVNFDQKSMSSIMYRPPHYTHTEPVPVPNITLNELLKKQGVKRFDFLSIDVEGSEPLVLAGFDIRRYKPKLVCVEANKSVDLQKKLMDYFTKNNYEIIPEYSRLDVGQNWFFTPKKTRWDRLLEKLARLGSTPHP